MYELKSVICDNRICMYNNGDQCNNTNLLFKSIVNGALKCIEFRPSDNYSDYIINNDS